jgi:putative ATP-binding cassette transporter
MTAGLLVLCQGTALSFINSVFIRDLTGQPIIQEMIKKQLRAFGEFWFIAKPYWVSERRFKAFGLLGGILAISAGTVYLSVLLNRWNQQFYDSLQSFDRSGFFRLILQFAFLSSLFVAASIYRYYFTQKLQIDWREWMTSRMLDRWLANKTYYIWKLSNRTTDNPDQRIAEDVKEFTSITLSLSLDLFHEILTLVSFISILWTLSGTADVQMLHSHVKIPGYMFWACLAYAGLGTYFMHRIGSPLVKLNFMQQRCEADFRFHLVRLREHAKTISEQNNERTEKSNLERHFSEIYSNFHDLIAKHKQMIGVQSFYNQIAVFFPYLVAAPRFFSKQITLGVLMQTCATFSTVRNSLSWIINSYSSLSLWRSVVQRLVQFEESITDAENEKGPKPYRETAFGPSAAGLQAR